MKKLVISMGAAALFVGAATAGAENRAETFTITPFIGGYTSDGVQHLETAPVIGVRGGYNFTDRLGAEAVFDFARGEGTHNNVHPDSKVSIYNYHADLLYHFIPSSKAVPFLMAGYGGISIDPEHGKTTDEGAFNYGLGLKYALSEKMELRGEVRHIMFKTDDTINNLEYGVGLGFVFGGAKPAPAPVAEPAPAPKVVPPPVVVPPPPAIPTANLTAVPALILAGSPATLNWACKNAKSADITPGIGSVPPQGARPVSPNESSVYKLTCKGDGGEATSSANVAVIKDSDKDGVFDNTDQCPQTPAGVKVDAKGCPLDTDKDGVPDYLDKCPATPEGKPVDKDGCSPETLTIKLDVLFDTAKADIKKKYNDEIAKVADFLTRYPTVTGTIEGHTDNVGDAAMNQKLSQRRADSVVKYLVEKFGIDKNRLNAKGYGEDKPVADNKTAAGRQQNRRTLASFETVVKH